MLVAVSPPLYNLTVHYLWPNERPVNWTYLGLTGYCNATKAWISVPTRLEYGGKKSRRRLSANPTYPHHCPLVFVLSFCSGCWPNMSFFSPYFLSSSIFCGWCPATKLNSVCLLERIGKKIVQSASCIKDSKVIPLLCTALSNIIWGAGSWPLPFSTQLPCPHAWCAQMEKFLLYWWRSDLPVPGSPFDLTPPSWRLSFVCSQQASLKQPSAVQGFFWLMGSWQLHW